MTCGERGRYRFISDSSIRSSAMSGRTSRRDHVSTARTTSNCPAYIASDIAAFQAPITSSAEHRRDRREPARPKVHVSRADDLELLADCQRRRRASWPEGRDDLFRRGAVDDADAL